MRQIILESISRHGKHKKLNRSSQYRFMKGKSWLMKLMKYRVDKCTMRWTENWLNWQIQRVVISGTKSSWRQDTSGVPQGSILEPGLSSIFINNLNNGPEHNRELGQGESHEVQQGKCKILHLWRNNPRYQYTLEANWEEDLWRRTYWTTRRPWANYVPLWNKKASSILDCIWKSIASRPGRDPSSSLRTGETTSRKTWA